MALYIGIMSGTSLDAIDVVLIESTDKLQLIASYSHPINTLLREQTRALNHASHNDLERCLVLDRIWGELFSEAVLVLLQQSGIDKNAVTAIGSHGQTVRHNPNTTPTYSLQIGDPNTIAELTGIDVVADFRRRDIAAGGQGAPLAPSFHQAVFSSQTENRAIINIGGMANITLLRAGQDTIGFDSGPGNVLLNAWIKHHKNLDFDAEGKWAETGKVITHLLDSALKDSYFSLPPPKSTGREQFDLHWLKALLVGNEKPENVQATLIEITARSICDALPHDIDALYLCGGGAFNRFLCERIAEISQKPVASTEALGIDPNWLEAIAFAWLAQQTIEKKAANLPSVTGAKAARILGAVYQA